jgi:hypothetical protein
MLCAEADTQDDLRSICLCLRNGGIQ